MYNFPCIKIPISTRTIFRKRMHCRLMERSGCKAHLWIHTLAKTEAWKLLVTGSSPLPSSFSHITLFCDICPFHMPACLGSRGVISTPPLPPHMYKFSPSNTVVAPTRGSGFDDAVKVRHKPALSAADCWMALFRSNTCTSPSTGLRGWNSPAYSNRVPLFAIEAQ